MKTQHLILKARAAGKAGKRRWKGITAPVLKSRAVQALMLMTSSIILLCTSVLFLFNLLGAALAAVVILAILDRAFGFRMEMPPGFAAF